MEDIKTNFDKIMAEFNDSLTHSAPKKLSFEHLNFSLNDSGTVPKKRRYSQSMDETPLDGSSASLNSSYVPPSPWESRRMRADIIEANARISKLKFEMERQHKLHVEKETVLESRVTELKKQCEYSANKVEDLEKHLQLVRKREQGYKQESHKVQKELQQVRTGFEEQLHKISRAKQQLEEDARHMQLSLSNELSEYRMHSEKIEMQLELASEELSNASCQLEKYKHKAALYDELNLTHQKQQQELETANSKIKELEYEISSYADWKEITKNSQSRLLSIQDKDKEIDRLALTNKRLQDLLGNKLLLEEQVHDLKTRLEREEGARNEAVALQVKLTHAEEELKEWVRIAQDHCLPNLLVSPMALRARIEQLLQNDIINTSEKSSNKSESKSLENELKDFKQQCEIYAKNNEELNIALKRHKAFKDRVQRKLILVSNQRDFYKQMLDNFEKDVTMTNVNLEASSMEQQLRNRIEMLEKTLSGYKDMCATMEKEISQSKQLNADPTLDSVISSDAYEHIKTELNNARMENERLRRRKEELELEFEHRYLKGDFNVDKYKLLVFKDSPSSEAYKNSENLVEKLQAEIERLKRRNQKLEADNELTQARLGEETSGMTVNIKELNTLRAELESANSKMKKMKELYKTANMEFRDVCYMILGYRIDRVGANGNYKVSSMYAESPDEYLNFRLNEANVDMLETPYSESETIKPLIESHLITNRSLPAFLSALTLELIQRATVTIT